MKPVAASYYMTTVCNAKCGFCNIWEGPAHLKPKLQKPEGVKHTLTALKTLGVKYIDFTGGEALLVRNLPDALRQAKEMGFKTGLVSNGFLYPARANEIEGLVDSMSFSLDSADEERHNKSRGLKCCSRVLESIEIARRRNQWVNINFSVANDNLHEIEPMVKLAQELKIVCHVMPVFSYFGNEAMDLRYAKAIRDIAKEPYISVNLAAVKFVEDGGNDIKKRKCIGPDANIAVTPDGKFLMPCYHAAVEQVPIELDVKAQWNSEKMRHLRDMSGRYDFCQGCTVWCYLTPSFFYTMDKYFFLQMYSYGRSSVNATLNRLRDRKLPGIEKIATA